MVSGVFRGAGKTMARAVCVSLPENVDAVFNQDNLRFELAKSMNPGKPPEPVRKAKFTGPWSYGAVPPELE
tara:strand:- start:5954 stop:6166 length:213 start_codon:yes stop_codon:yes gene_type:complete